MRYPTALTIAGSDSGGGAGIQADLKTFLDHRVFGMSVICAVTAQNTQGVRRVDPIPIEGVLAQLQALFDDLPVDVVKIGMLGNAPLTQAVAGFLRELPSPPPIILDPVMVATTGARLLEAEAVAVLVDELLPLCELATPNLDEIAVLTGSTDPEVQRRWAADAPCAVLITGGDADTPTLTDTLVRGALTSTYTHRRQGHTSLHGTGCTLSSAIAARRARGDDLQAAVEGAIDYVQRLVARGIEVSVGQGHPVLPHGLFNTP